nr:MAG TPA: hypothetical protein [Caudoviricetes sp.]
MKREYYDSVRLRQENRTRLSPPSIFRVFT